tara:strand:- start:3032 stop:3859 length:828 start_codon:yes stop_codon:yes gene_type:complete
MRNYGTIQTSFWTHPKINVLSDKAKLLFLYLITGHHANALGCYRIPKEYIKADLGWTTKDLLKPFSELENFLILYDLELSVLLIPDFLQWNPIPNPNSGQARWAELQLINENFQYFHVLIDRLEPFQDRLPEPLPKVCNENEKGLPQSLTLTRTLTITEQEQKQENGRNRPKRNSFNSEERKQSEEVLEFLNQTKSKFGVRGKFKLVNSHLKFISARLKEGHTVAECRQVIVVKTKQWANTDMAIYLRPSTLFNEEKFNNYIGELGVQENEVSRL